HPRPNGPCGWQWQGTHKEFGWSVDRGWFEDSFVAGHVAKTHWASLGGSFQHDPVVAQNQDGRLELLALGAGGHLLDLAQSAPNGSWSPSWADLCPPPAAGAASNPVVGRNLDGRLELFLRGMDGHIYRRSQQRAGGPFTPTWESLGGSFQADPTVG